MTLGENLQKLRAAKGLSQQDVARTLYVSRQSVSKWENDAAEPGVENLKALAKLFGVTLDRLLLAEVPKRQPPEPERPPYSGKLEWSLLREGEQAMGSGAVARGKVPGAPASQGQRPDGLLGAGRNPHGVSDPAGCCPVERDRRCDHPFCMVRDLGGAGAEKALAALADHRA